MLDNNFDNYISCEVEALFQDDSTVVLKSIIGCMYCGIIMAKPGIDGFVLWNESAKEILGKPQADIPDVDWPAYYGCYDPNTNELMSHADLPLVKSLNGEDVDDVEIIIRNEFQPFAIINCNSKAIKRDGQVVGAVVVFRDVTKERSMEKELQSLVGKLNSIKCGLQERITSL